MCIYFLNLYDKVVYKIYKLYIYKLIVQFNYSNRKY